MRVNDVPGNMCVVLLLADPHLKARAFTIKLLVAVGSCRSCSNSPCARLSNLVT